jgi:hypothetical protein
MARGRPPKPEADRKSHYVSFRARSALRKRLATAAEESERSISEEIEHRLEHSFLRADLLAAVLGRGDVADFLRVMISAFLEAGSTAAKIVGVPENNWLNNPFAFDQAAKTLNFVLEAGRPPGYPKLSDAEAYEWASELFAKLRFNYAESVSRKKDMEAWLMESLAKLDIPNDKQKNEGKPARERGKVKPPISSTLGISMDATKPSATKSPKKDSIPETE